MYITYSKRREGLVSRSLYIVIGVGVGVSIIVNYLEVRVDIIYLIGDSL